MGVLNMRVWDVTGSRCQQMQAPDDVPVGRLLIVLIERLNLPINSPDGQIMSYKLHHKRSGRQLLESQTLAEAMVMDGDDLRLQPEITAGGRPSAGDCGLRIADCGLTWSASMGSLAASVFRMIRLKLTNSFGWLARINHGLIPGLALVPNESIAEIRNPQSAIRNSPELGGPSGKPSLP